MMKNHRFCSSGVVPATRGPTPPSGRAGRDAAPCAGALSRARALFSPCSTLVPSAMQRRRQQQQQQQEEEGRQSGSASGKVPKRKSAFMERISNMMREEEVTLASWLASLDLEEQYLSLFEEKGYGHITHIQRAGLEDEDLDFIGVTVPMHRRMLKAKSAELKLAGGVTGRARGLTGSSALF